MPSLAPRNSSRSRLVAIMYGEDEQDEATKFGHPDSVIRLASAVHRFQVPRMADKKPIRFVQSFKTVGQNPKTKAAMNKSDITRKALQDALTAKNISHERVVADAKRYIPNIHQILLTCKVQPEVARLDERLLFEWYSGIEKEPKPYRSEAIMYDVVMAIVSEGLGKAGAATEASRVGEFAAANRDFKAAAGIFEFLATDYLPKWISKGASVEEESLPSECSVATATALKILSLANSQQMAVATLLIKPGTPNYSLLAKLCLGIVDQLEAFVSTMRSEATVQKERMDKNVFTLVTFQINLLQGLTLYFQARHLWESEAKYGMAIAMLSEATVALRTRESAVATGLPDLTKNVALQPLQNDLLDLRGHFQKLLRHWETDNSHVYFEQVPQKVPVDQKIQEGVTIGKVTPYKLSEVEPLLLSLPDHALERSDSDLARELQERLNAGEFD